MPSTPLIRVVDCHVVAYEGTRPSFLVLRRARNTIYSGDYRMVGGKIVDGEAAWQTALRELKEETGLWPVRFYALPFVNRFYEPKHDRLNDIPVFLAVVNEPGDVFPAKVSLNEEHDHFQWLPAEAAKRHLEWPGQKAGIDAALSLLESETLHRHLAIATPRSEAGVSKPCLTQMKPAPDQLPIPDTQAASDSRGIGLDEVGVCDVKHPFIVEDGEGTTQNTIATCSLSVALPGEQRGTHMSRFLQVLNEWCEPVSVNGISNLAREVRVRLEAHSSEVLLVFPWFAKKQAPKSGITSLLDYEVKLLGRCSATSSDENVELTVRVPVKSLCPCSKAISQYGAHNQRSHITVTVVPKSSALSEYSIGALITLLEEQASSQVYGVLKRADEKWVTERAYENPKFVEDITRDVVLALRRDPRLRHFDVRVDNFESIHNHTAFARYLGTSSRNTP